MFVRLTHALKSETWWRHQMETFSALLALCAGNSPVPVNSPHKGQWRGALMFALICIWRNDWVNNREAGDLRPGLGSNTFYQIQIQIQIQKFGFFKYKYKYKYFLQPWFKYKYKYKYIHSNTNTNTNTFNQIYLPKLFRIQNREILQIPRCMLMACVSLCLGDTWSLPLCISGNFTGTRAVGVG